MYYVFIGGRGSLGFGEDALQSLPGKVGSQVCMQPAVSFFFFLSIRLSLPHGSENCLISSWT